MPVVDDGTAPVPAGADPFAPGAGAESEGTPAGTATGAAAGNSTAGAESEESPGAAAGAESEAPADAAGGKAGGDGAEVDITVLSLQQTRNI